MIHFRHATTNDVGFVKHAWATEYKFASASRYIPTDIYNASIRDLIDSILPKSLCIIACENEAPEHNYGFFCWTPQIKELPLLAHWIYVKDDYRRMGIARQLITAAIPTVKQHTITTTFANKLFQNEDIVNSYKLSYNPYSLFNLLGQTHASTNQSR